MTEATAKLIWRQERNSQQSEALKKAYGEGRIKTAFQRGHRVPESWRDISRAVNQGSKRHVTPHSDETKAKISQNRRGKAVAANNGFWNGGTSRCYRTGYYSTQYKEWRVAVFQRDIYTCQYCGQVGGYLTAHHIKGQAAFPELRFDVTNGLTLCEACHAKTDNYKGRACKKGETG